MKTKILCIIGRSGSGKTTIEQMLRHYDPHTYHRIVSHTTRPMREGERQGREHWFVTEKAMPTRSGMIAYTRYGNADYWTDRSSIVPGFINTYVIDTDGFRYLRDLYGDEFDIRVLYIRRPAPSDIDPDRMSRDTGRMTLLAEETDIIYDNTGDIDDLDRHVIAIDAQIKQAFKQR